MAAKKHATGCEVDLQVTDGSARFDMTVRSARNVVVGKRMPQRVADPGAEAANRVTPPRIRARRGKLIVGDGKDVGCAHHTQAVEDVDSALVASDADQHDVGVAGEQGLECVGF